MLVWPRVIVLSFLYLCTKLVSAWDCTTNEDCLAPGEYCDMRVLWHCRPCRDLCAPQYPDSHGECRRLCPDFHQNGSTTAAKRTTRVPVTTAPILPDEMTSHIPRRDKPTPSVSRPSVTHSSSSTIPAWCVAFLVCSSLVSLLSIAANIHQCRARRNAKIKTMIQYAALTPCNALLGGQRVSEPEASSASQKSTTGRQVSCDSGYDAVCLSVNVSELHQNDLAPRRW